jgi:hypothetical protein
MARRTAARADEAAGPTPAEQGLATLILAAVKIMKTRLAEPLLELNLVACHREPLGKLPNVHVLYHIYGSSTFQVESIEFLKI